MQTNLQRELQEVKQITSRLKKEITQIRKILRAQNYQRSWIRTRRVRKVLGSVRYDYNRICKSSLKISK
jgi:hypothetical protein